MCCLGAPRRHAIQQLTCARLVQVGDLDTSHRPAASRHRHAVAVGFSGKHFCQRRRPFADQVVTSNAPKPVDLGRHGVAPLPDYRGVGAEGKNGANAENRELHVRVRIINPGTVRKGKEREKKRDARREMRCLFNTVRDCTKFNLVLLPCASDKVGLVALYREVLLLPGTLFSSQQ